MVLQDQRVHLGPRGRRDKQDLQDPLVHKDPQVLRESLVCRALWVHRVRVGLRAQQDKQELQDLQGKQVHWAHQDLWDLLVPRV